MKYAKIDLHLHLDGSIDIEWGWKRALAKGLVPSTCTFEEYYDSLYTRKEGAPRMSIFDIPISVMQTYEELYEATYNLIKKLHEKKMVYAEIRFASQQHCLEGLTQYEVVQAVIDGQRKALEDFPDIKTGIINCMMHKGENAAFNMKENLETIEVTKQFLGKGVVALDLAGFENTGPFLDYAPLFEKAREYGIPYTIHAGEMGLGEHVPEAISMGAYRIGHGINCIQNDAWLQQVIDTQIPLEVCVSSNCGPLRNYASHPIRKLIRSGVKVTINTDNMMFSKTDLAYEHSQLKEIGVTDEELKQCMYHAIEVAFCDEMTREWIRSRVEE
ncbi:MAG: hypothetical protein IJP28_05450 [Erysipelotrichales bacterium]|nr:hypothetical protein [Erysipelotrichales bacterium]